MQRGPAPQQLRSTKSIPCAKGAPDAPERNCLPRPAGCLGNPQEGNPWHSTGQPSVYLCQPIRRPCIGSWPPRTRDLTAWTRAVGAGVARASAPPKRPTSRRSQTGRTSAGLGGVVGAGPAGVRSGCRPGHRQLPRPVADRAVVPDVEDRPRGPPEINADSTSPTAFSTQLSPVLVST